MGNQNTSQSNISQNKEIITSTTSNPNIEKNEEEKITFDKIIVVKKKEEVEEVDYSEEISKLELAKKNQIFHSFFFFFNITVFFFFCCLEISCH